MKPLLSRPATADGIFVWVLHRFAEVFEENPEFAYMAITNTDGNVLFARGTEPIGARTHFRNPVVLQIAHETTDLSKAARVGQQYIVSMPINDAGKPLGVLHVGIDAAFVDHVLLEVLLDVVVVLVVSLFFTLELLNFMAGARLASGLGEFARQVDRMRSGDFTATARIRANDEIGRLLRRIDSLRPESPRTGQALRPSQEAVRLAQQPALDFAPAALSAFPLAWTICISRLIPST